MNTKESYYDKETLSLNQKKTDTPELSRCCSPDKYLRNAEQHRDNIIQCLVYARKQVRPPFNEEFTCLVKLWRLIASKDTSDRIPGADLEFLRWLLQGRARQAIVYLRRQSDINVWYALKAIERIANFNIPGSDAIEHQLAMADWIWLNRELTGDSRKKSNVDIRKIRLKQVKPQLSNN